MTCHIPLPHKRHRGFTLIELMVGLLVGLVATLAITQILLTSEGQKRSTTAGSDAQVSGVLAMDSLRNAIQDAGYGFGSLAPIIGCPLVAKYNNSNIAGFPANLVPVQITDGLNGLPDSIRVLASSKTTFSVPAAVTDPGYKPGVATLNKAFPVLSNVGVSKDDLMIAATDASSDCEVFQVTAAPTGNALDRADDAAHWNAVGRPAQLYGAALGSVVVNMGEFNDLTFSVSTNGSLQLNRLVLGTNSAPTYSGSQDLYSNIVNLQAYYGKASTIDGSTITMAPIDQWDTALPTTNSQWLQVLAIKLALVTRSDQYEKTEVTTSDPVWDVGPTSPIAGTTACPHTASKCITLKIPHSGTSTDWKHYRYRVFDTVIPLRNMIYSR